MDRQPESTESCKRLAKELSDDEVVYASMPPSGIFCRGDCAEPDYMGSTRLIYNKDVIRHYKFEYYPSHCHYQVLFSKGKGRYYESGNPPFTIRAYIPRHHDIRLAVFGNFYQAFLMARKGMANNKIISCHDGACLKELCPLNITDGLITLCKFSGIELIEAMLNQSSPHDPRPLEHVSSPEITNTTVDYSWVLLREEGSNKRLLRVVHRFYDIGRITMSIGPYANYKPEINFIVKMNDPAIDDDAISLFCKPGSKRTRSN